MKRGEVMKYVVITGASSGIGNAAAADLVSRGYHVFGSVRKRSDADLVKAQLGNQFTPLLFDVTNVNEIKAAADEVEEVIGETSLTALVNNAGIVTPGPLAHMPLQDFRRQLEVNVTGVLSVTQAFLPLLGTRKRSPFPPGRIINMSSVSGQIVYPFMGAYAASKHALEALSDALRRELLLYGIDVILIEPGTVQTPMMSKFGEQARKYAGTDYQRILASLDVGMEERERTALPVQRVVDLIRTALEAKRPRTRYPLPRKRLVGWLLPRLPDRWFDRLVANQILLDE
jgi:NAD(P)-dependent dehydrogenase (short-subunit alcohol dehydrogenase family)